MDTMQIMSNKSCFRAFILSIMLGLGCGFCWDGVIQASELNVQSYPQLIFPGDYPDPTILRDGEDYYMTHSSFLYTPGFLIWHSKDLKHWEPICRAMTELVGSALAPDLVKHREKYYIYFPAAGRNWVIWAPDIRGPWSNPIRLSVDQIDPGHVVGEDGKRYLFLSDGYRVQLEDDGLAVRGGKEKVYSGWAFPEHWITQGLWLEAPKLFRKGEYFYMVVAEGGTAGPPTSHMAVVARSKSIHGPWENSPHNPVVHTYSGNEQWWSKGHGTVIDDIHGNWWIVYHAYENGYYTLGRQTLLEPIEWLEDGWLRTAKTAPRAVNPHVKPVKHGLTLSDDFSGDILGLQWMTWRDYDPQSIVLKNGSLYLKGQSNRANTVRMLLVTATDHSYEIQTQATVPEGSRGGLVLFYNEQAHAGIVSDGQQFTVFEQADKTVKFDNPYGSHVFMKIVNQMNVCDLFVSPDGQTWNRIYQGLDVSNMHQNVYDGGLALRVGLMASGQGAVEFDEFTYKALPEAR